MKTTVPLLLSLAASLATISLVQLPLDAYARSGSEPSRAAVPDRPHAAAGNTTTSPTVRLVPTGLDACNPRIEVCEMPARPRDDDARETSDSSDKRPIRGWLSDAACNPRIKVCER